MLAVDDLLVRRGAFEVRASFECTAGATVALLGPNGAGKSSLVAALAGLQRVEGGRVALAGAVLDDPRAGIHVSERDRPIGAVFQDLLLFPHLSALENTAFPLRARGRPAGESRDRAGSLLRRLGVAHRAAARPAQLSGGEAQRVALARALVHEPSMLLLDEPLSALDVRAKANIRDLLRRELGSFPGVRVLVAHQPMDALTLADRVVILEDGRVTQIGSPEEIRTAPRTPYAADLVGVNFFRGTLEPLGDGVVRLITDAGSIVVATEGRPATSVIATLSPADVSLHVERPSGSPRNALFGRVASIWVDAGRARVRVDSEPPIVADVTTGSLERLGIREGTGVWAAFKAVEVLVEGDRTGGLEGQPTERSNREG
jgi:molybdate transport system ATP-binding protein